MDDGHSVFSAAKHVTNKCVVKVTGCWHHRDTFLENSSVDHQVHKHRRHE